MGRDVGSVLTDYVYWGNNLLYETTSGKAIDYIWAEGKLLAKVENSGTTYFHHDQLGSSKLQTDESGNVVSTDVTQPFGPRICADAVKDELANLDKVDTAASKIAFDATSGIIKAPKDANGYQTGELYTTELKSGVDARVVKLDWTGSGVTFYVSTDGSSWSALQKDQPFILGTPGRSLYLKAVLAADASSVLERYLLQINPTGFNLFTGKMLTEETGLVYFGARWYDPELGRFITVDPAEDGENWYAFCENDPVNNFDPDGRLNLRGWGVLWGGLKVGFKEYALNTAADVTTGIAIGSAVAVCMPAIMPTLPAAIPVIVAAASYIGIAGDIGPDLAYLVRDFSTVFLSRNPSDRKVHSYGVRVSKVGLQFAGMLATSYGMNAIMKTGILAKIGIGGNDAVSKTPASRLADKVRNYASSKKINTVAVIRTQNGRYIVGRNSGGVTNLEVQNALENIGVNEFQGQCAEVNAISRALNKGVNLEGATISIANVRGPNSTNGLHGTFKQPCSTCDALIEVFGLTVTK